MDLTASFEGVDVSDELGQWAQVKESLITLEAYYNEIASHGAISRDQAKALVADCGLQLGSSYPPESFTQLPSQTNFGVAMEGMFEVSVQLLWQLVKKAAELLLKIIRWIIEVIRQHRARSRNTQAMADKVTAFGEVNQELKAAGLAAAFAASNDVEEVIAAKQRSDAAVELFDQLYSELVHDIIQSHPHGFTVGLRNIGVEVFELAELVSAKLQLFDQTVTAHPSHSASGAQVVMLSELRTIATPIPTQRLSKTLGMYGMAVQGQQNFAAVMNQLFERFQTLRNTPSEEQFTPESALALITANGSKATAPFSLKPERDMDTMQTIERYLAKMQALQPSNVASPEVRKAFTDAINCVTSEVQALRAFMSVFHSCENVRDQFFDALFKVELEEFMTYREVAKVSQDPKVVEAINEAQRELKNRHIGK